MLGASHKTLPTVVALLAALQGVHSHVFNAIYSALRKWESSINAGGNDMSVRLPGDSPQRRAALPWKPRARCSPRDGIVAFDPEFSQVFARKRHHGTGRPGQLLDEKQQQQIIEQKMADNDDDELAGWLHTYRTTTNLNLLYTDGHSAIKGQGGTLDFGGRVLLNDTVSGGVEAEYHRARTFCDWAQNE